MKKVWSFAVVDLDLLRSDPDVVDAVFPSRTWGTRDAAEDALVAELLEEQEEWGLDEEELFGMDRDDLDWQEDSSCGRKRWVTSVAPGCLVYLYEMEAIG